MRIYTFRRIAFLLVIAVYTRYTVQGQIFINEFLASNASVNVDPDFSEYADWIELYNAGNSNVNLNGYFITDNLDNPSKWSIAEDIIIPAKGYALIWTDGMNSGVHASYKIAQEGEEIGLFSPAYQLLDSVSFGAQIVDVSLGRSPDGSASWRYFKVPTPGASNNTTAYDGMVYHQPEYSITGGFYETNQTIVLSTSQGGIIRYTLDGSEPDTNSEAYTEPITIHATTVVRARIFIPGLIPGPVNTQSYFINEDFAARKLPVVSIATDPENFWDPVKGIYVQDFKPDWEVPVNIELFEDNGSDRAAFNQTAGVKINGLYSWRLPQKMLGVYFRKQYGSSGLDYHLFFEKDRSSFKSFALRASGSDWSYTLFRDALIQDAVDYNMDIDFMAFRAGILYVNGEYMGINNMREKVDEDYIMRNHNLEKGTIDMVENEDYAEAGDLNAYNNFKTLVSRDLSVQSNYNAVDTAMDIENFTDIIITEIYDRNTSISHNVMAWKPKDFGKWKWILMDLDRGFFSASDRNISFYLNQEEWPFNQLFANAGYKQYFAKRLADHLYTTFNPQRILKRIDYHQQLIESEIPNHIERWLGTTSSYGNAMPSVDYWVQQVDALRDFARNRPAAILTNLQSYGLSPAVILSLNTLPANGGSFEFNKLKIPDPIWTGLYPEDLPCEIKAISKPGFVFSGWKGTVIKNIIPVKASWKYLDNGSDQGTGWYAVSFNDSGWKSGSGKFGYGDGDEQTTISYGSDSNNKYITTYFRKTFELDTADMPLAGIIINLLRDDGAVVYINGQEVLRSNMSQYKILYNTTATTSVSGEEESQYFEYTIGPSVMKAGTNLIAVEVHQESKTSSDLGFDLKMDIATNDPLSWISTDAVYVTTLTSPQMLTAVYEPTGECVLPDTIRENTTLHEDCSPYLVQGDITVPENTTLTIEPGVEILMLPGSDMLIHGNMIASGNSEKRIKFRINPAYQGQSWGALCFIETTNTTTMKYVTIEDASSGPVPIRDVAAISAYKATLVLDHMILEKINYNPIAGRYSDITLTNSSLHSDVTGDLINVKYGRARIENCDFRGNRFPDTDAIDYDNVDHGIIRNCRIYELQGFNSDGIDLGEKATDIIIDSVSFNNITDKGISVGQQSTVYVTHCTFVNCNLGLGLKDSCQADINHCTFYGVNTPVACFEKNPGSAGGNGMVRNSILSNSYDATYSSDNKSTITITNCLSDNDSLPDNGTNLFGNPLFANPTLFDYSLLTGSPAIGSSDEGSYDRNLGSLFYNISGMPSVLITKIFYNPLNEPDKHEFIGIFNPSSGPADLSGYTFTKGIEYTFPEGTMLDAGKSIMLLKDYTGQLSSNGFSGFYRWTYGSLENSGEVIQLTDSTGIIIDKVVYSPYAPWPDMEGSTGRVLSLIDPSLDNHFGENWMIEDYDSILYGQEEPEPMSFRIYPNPSTGTITIETPDAAHKRFEVYTTSGVLVYTGILNNEGHTTVNLSHYRQQMLLIRIGATVEKVIFLKESH